MQWYFLSVDCCKNFLLLVEKERTVEGNTKKKLYYNHKRTNEGRRRMSKPKTLFVRLPSVAYGELAFKVCRRFPKHVIKCLTAHKAGHVKATDSFNRHLSHVSVVIVEEKETQFEVIRKICRLKRKDESKRDIRTTLKRTSVSLKSLAFPLSSSKQSSRFEFR